MNQFDKIINHFKKKFEPSRIPSVWNRAYKRYDTSVYENDDFVINPNTNDVIPPRFIDFDKVEEIDIRDL